MERQIQFLEIKAAVPVGYQAEGYDFVKPDGLYLDDANRIKRNTTGRTGRRKFILVRREGLGRS